MAQSPFRFKKFSVEQAGAAHPVGTDGVLLGAWAEVEGCRRMLDIGTGTGVVALMLAQRSTAAASILALDIHPPSVALARGNFAASPWADCLEVLEMPVQDYARNIAPQFNLIVSNPPFFSETTVSPDTDRRMGRHTASLSPETLLAAVGALLTAEGRFCAVLPVREGRRLCELAVPQGLYCTETVEVFTRPGKPAERLLLRFERDPYRLIRRELVLYAPDGTYSADYRRLTGDFYLAF